MNLQVKLELIHSIKCSKTDSSHVAEQSFRELTGLKERLQAEGDTPSLQIKIENWKNSYPIATDKEIKKLSLDKSSTPNRNEKLR